VDPSAFFASVDGVSPNATSGSSEEFGSDKIFEDIEKRLKSTPGLVKAVNCVYQFVVTKGEGNKRVWLVDLKNGDGSVKRNDNNEHETKPDLILTLSDENLILMSEGKLNGQQAFMQKKVTKLRLLFPLLLPLSSSSFLSFSFSC
jgi:putative sterol carrier protein